MGTFINKYITLPIKSKINSFIGFIYYLLASIKRKFASKITGIFISANGDRIDIQFSVMFKQNHHTMTPIEIIDAKSLLSTFSQNEASMIGLLSTIYFHESKTEKLKQIEKIKKLFPKLGQFIHYGSEEDTGGESHE